MPLPISFKIQDMLITMKGSLKTKDLKPKIAKAAIEAGIATEVKKEVKKKAEKSDTKDKSEKKEIKNKSKD